MTPVGRTAMVTMLGAALVILLTFTQAVIL